MPQIVNPFKVGDIVELTQKWGQKPYADIGTLAIVVNGQTEFPNMYKHLKDDLDALNSGGSLEEFLWIRWEDAPKRNNAKNGAYLYPVFELHHNQNVDLLMFDWGDSVKDDKNVNVAIAPPNNDGRSVCFWCNSPTKRISNGNVGWWDVCTNKKCGK